MATETPIKLTGALVELTQTQLDSSWKDATDTAYTFVSASIVLFVRVDPAGSGPWNATFTVTEQTDFQGRKEASQAGITLDAQTDFFICGPFPKDGWADASGLLQMTCTGTGASEIQVIGIRDWGAES